MDARLRLSPRSGDSATAGAADVAAEPPGPETAPAELVVALDTCGKDAKFNDKFRSYPFFSPSHSGSLPKPSSLGEREFAWA